MGRPKLKRKQDGTFGFRVANTLKDELEQMIEEVRARLNEMSPSDLYNVTTSEVVIAALRKGLSGLEYKDLDKRQKRKQK
jgi:hypothetical protein